MLDPPTKQTLLAFLGATVAVAACSKTVDKSDAEKKVKAFAEQAIGAVTKVACPSAKHGKGVTFECTVAFKDGGDYKVAIEQQDDQGNVTMTWPVQPIGTDAMEKLMADDFKAKGLEVTVDCGSGVVTLPAEGVDCKVSAAGRDTTDYLFKLEGTKLTWAPKNPPAAAPPDVPADDGAVLDGDEATGDDEAAGDDEGTGDEEIEGSGDEHAPDHGAGDDEPPMDD
ncbi:MAG: DUF4333 domain-containing protein [Kofleriaceae bacterium]|nr:DUF4333 domain-containing protein [Myxococcales bacterium]MCB9561788.1 DUF4333 domain-containing protein [Kofleriaceae bacterium]MCB9575303.1 DUF4333 domain-containing protein [Kofleriaceae bacterium]